MEFVRSVHFNLHQINMVTPAVLTALIGNLLFKSAISAAIDYEPIKITVNENFNSLPSQVSAELPGLEPSLVHQGVNFYFKPQLKLQPSYIPSHIEALMTLIDQHYQSCAKDASKAVVKKDKLIEILKPFMSPWSDISKETNRLEEISSNPLPMPIISSEEPTPVTTELLVIPEAPELPPLLNNGFPSTVGEKVKKEETVLLGEPTGVSVETILEPFINYVEPKNIASELLVIPAAPVLPPLTTDDFSTVVKEDVKTEKSIMLEEPTGVFQSITEIPTRPIEEPIIKFVEPTPITSELESIPEAPVLPALTFKGFSEVVKNEVKKEESSILERLTGEFPTIPEINVRPIENPIINYVEPKSSELVGIPKAPVLPPLSVNGFSYAIEEVQKEKSVISEEPTVFPKIPKIAVKPIEEPIINYVEPKFMTAELVVVPEAPVLPPLSFNGFPSTGDAEVNKESVISVEPTGVFPTIPELSVETIPEPFINYIEPKLNTSEDVAIPEAPVLPPLNFNDFSDVVGDKVKKEESMALQKLTGALPIIPKIYVRPIEDSIINYDEPKPMTSELVVIPKAPVLPPLSVNGFSSAIEEVQKEKSVISEEPTGVFPKIPKITVKPIEEPIINYVEPKSMTPELVVVPEAPVLPPLSFNGFPSTGDAEVNKEESVISVEPTGVFPTIPELSVETIPEPFINYIEPKLNTSEDVAIPEAPEIAVRPIEEPMIKYTEPKPMTSELVVIPKAPVLPPLSLNGLPSAIEEMKKEKLVILEEPTGVFPKIPKITVKPIEELTSNYVEPKPMTSELVVVPEAPVLPPLSFSGFPSTGDAEVNKEEIVILGKPTSMFPTIPEIAVSPTEEPIINYDEPKLMTSKLVAVPEAPVLPPLLLNGFPFTVEEGVKKGESEISGEPTGVFPTIPELSGETIPEPFINYIEPKLTTSELLVIPEAPVLPPVTSDDFPAVVKQEVKKEKSMIMETPTGAFPTIPKIAVRPIEEPIINFTEPKLMTSELFVIPKAPVVPPLSLYGFSSAIEEVQKEKSVILEEPTGVFPKIPKITVKPIEELTSNYVEPKPMTSELVVVPEAPVLPPLSFSGFPSTGDAEVNKEEIVILGKPTRMFPTIPALSVETIPEPFINYIEPKLIASEDVVIPEAPVLRPLTSQDLPTVVKEEVKKEKSIMLEEPKFPKIPENSVRPDTVLVNVDAPTVKEFLTIPEAPALPPLFNIPAVEELKLQKTGALEESTDLSSLIPENSVRPTGQEPVAMEIEPESVNSDLIELPEPPVLPPLSNNGIIPIGEEVKIEESLKVGESTGAFNLIPDISAKPIPEPTVISQTGESFALENGFFPVGAEEIKIEIPIILEESIEVFPPIADIYSGSTLQDAGITNSYVLEEVSQPNSKRVVTVKETIPPTIIPKPSNNIGVFSYKPILSHLSKGAPKTKTMFSKPASLERFLLQKHPFRLPVTPFPKLSQNTIKSPIRGNKNQILYPTSYAHDVVEKRIASNMAFKNNAPPKRVKIYVRSNVPKGRSYL